MKNKKKWYYSLMMILLVCMLACIVPMDTSAAKSGWVKKTYYYQNGKKQKNKWKTIGKSKYYFKKDGKAAKGIVVIKGKLYSFSSTGKWNKDLSKRLQDAAKYEKDFTMLRKLLGTPKKATYVTGCYGNGKDGILKYSGYTVYTYRENDSEIFMGVE